MADEASKTKDLFGQLEKAVFKGKGIDIGCGPDPILPDVKRFDQNDGDANRISEYVHEQFDFVFSSHCLEHMHDPYAALKEWWKLVKEGGYLYVTVPEEDLYEQGHWPSIYNSDHKHTFTMYKDKSWSPVSVNVLDLVRSLPDAQVIKVELQDYGYDYTLKDVDQTFCKDAMAQICFVLCKGNPDKQIDRPRSFITQPRKHFFYIRREGKRVKLYFGSKKLFSLRVKK